MCNFNSHKIIDIVSCPCSSHCWVILVKRISFTHVNTFISADLSACCRDIDFDLCHNLMNHIIFLILVIITHQFTDPEVTTGLSWGLAYLKQQYVNRCDQGYFRGFRPIKFIQTFTNVSAIRTVIFHLDVSKFHLPATALGH